MAVIRQQTQVFNKPVGVRRINTGEAEVWEQVAAQADNFRSRALQKAATEAEQAGKMKGMAVESGQISAIDPTTNQPVAFKAPANFGEIAASSYQDIITRRFEQSVDNELKTQGAYYAQNAGNSDEYKNAISGHVGNMINAGGDDTYFSRYIQEAGQSYVDSTYLAMKSKELQASILETNTNAHFSMVENRELIKRNIIAQNITGVNDSIDKQKKVINDLFNVKYYTRAQRESELDSLRGLEALTYNTELTTYFANLPKADRVKFLVDLDNPNNIEDPNIKTLVINALATHNKQTLIEGFNKTVARSEDLTLSEVQKEVSKFLPAINSNMSSRDIDSLTLPIEDEKVRNEVRSHLKLDYINKLVSFKADNSKDATLFINELRKAEPNNETLAGLLRKNFNKDSDMSLDVQQSLEFIQNLTSKERISIAENLSSRLPSIKSIESSAANKREQGYRENIRNIKTTGDYKDVIKSIEKDNTIVNKDTLLELTKNVYANRMNQSAAAISLSYNELENVSIALGDKRGVALLETPQEILAFEQYKDAHNINPSSVNAAIASRLKASAQINLDIANEVKTKALKGAIEKGISVPHDDMEFLQKEIMGEEIFLTAENIENYPIMTDALKKGIMFPAFKSFFNSAVTSTNEATVAKAGNLFEEMTRVKVDSEGMSYQIDMLKANMKPETYAQLNAAAVTARAEYTTPFLVISELRQYDGNLDEDVLADYNNSTGGNLKKIKSIFDDRNVSPNFRKELSIAIKMQKSRGVQITEEAVDTIVENYIETNNMGRDTNVIAPHIDGATAYPVLSFINEVNFTQNRIALTKAIAQDDAYSPLLKGGTKLDQARELVKDLTLQNLPTLLRATVQSFRGQYQARSEIADVGLTREGHKVLNTDLFWKPDLMSFANGVPKYTAQYKDVNNTFQDLIVNGEPWALERIGDYRDEFRSVAHKEFIAKLRSTKPKIKAEGYINYQATLKHMTFAEFIKDPEFNELVAAYGNEEEVKIAYATQRLRWNAQSNNAFREQLMNIDIKDAALQYLRGVEGIGQN
tara:strand:+ start:496 stop:3618 length:3123 start_codon:yes stop_codon:yes gene_type:complete